MTVTPRHVMTGTSRIPKRKLSPVLTQKIKMVSTPINTGKKVTKPAATPRAASKRKYSPVMMSTPTMTKSGLFTTPVAIRFNPRQTPVSSNKVKRQLDYSAVKNTTPKINKMLSNRKTLVRQTVNTSDSAIIKPKGDTVSSLTQTCSTETVRPIQGMATIDKGTQTSPRPNLKTRRRCHDRTAAKLHPSKKRLFSSKQLSSKQTESSVCTTTSETTSKQLFTLSAESVEQRSVKLDLCKRDSFIMQEIIRALPLIDSEQINLNDLIDDCIKNHKLQKNSKESRHQKCACIFCVMEKSAFFLSTELLFKAFVKFVLKVLSCMDVKCFQ